MTKHRSIILALFCLSSVQFLHAQTWYESYERGVDDFRNQQWQKAIGNLSSAIEDQPNSKAKKKTYGMNFIDYFPYVYRGVAYAKLGDRTKALADLEKAEKEGVTNDADEDTEAGKLLSSTLEQLRKPPPQQAVQVDARFTEGVRLYNQKDYKDAVEKLKAVPESSPQYKDATRYLGLAQAEVRKMETAAAEREKKDRVDRAFNAGVQYFRENDLARAEEQFKIVLGLDEKRSDARDYLDRIKTERVKLAAASVPALKENPRPTVREPVRETPRTVEKPLPDTTKSVIFRDALSLFSGGKIAQAKVKFLSLEKLDPSYPDLKKYLESIGTIEDKTRQGISAFLDGDYRQAIDRLSETSRSSIDNPHLYAFLACSYAAEYLLRGTEDKTLHQNAVEAFGKLRAVDPQYALDRKFISPRIITLLSAP